MGNDHIHPLVKDLIEKEAIRELLLRYCHAVDRKDYEMLRSTYFEDAYDDHGSFKGSRDEFVTWVERRHEHIDQSMHFIGNCLIEVAGDVAFAETYCLGLQQLGPGADETRQMYDDGIDDDASRYLTVGCRYADRIEKRDGEWRIAHRTVIIESVRVHREPQIPFHGDWVPQQRSSSDAIYQYLDRDSIRKPRTTSE